jgi:hypothetical protein
VREAKQYKTKAYGKAENQAANSSWIHDFSPIEHGDRMDARVAFDFQCVERIRRAHAPEA